MPASKQRRTTTPRAAATTTPPVPPVTRTAGDIERILTRNHPNGIAGVTLHSVCDGDLVIVFTPKKLNVEDKTELMRDVREAILCAGRCVGIVVLPAGCSMDIAAGAAPEAFNQDGREHVEGAPLPFYVAPFPGDPNRTPAVDRAYASARFPNN